MSLSRSKVVAPVKGSQVVQRIGSLLRELAKQNQKGARLVDLYRAVGLEQPTAHRLLKALAAEKLVYQDMETRRYFLGSFIAELGLAAQFKVDLRTFARRTLELISAYTEDTVYLLAQSGGYECVCLDRVEGSYPVKVLTLDVGGRRPLGTNASGLSILGALPEDEVEDIINHNSTIYAESEVISENFVRSQVQEFKRNGYVFVSIALGTKTVGIPILGADGRPVAAVAVAAIESRMSEKRKDEIVEFMKLEIEKLEVL